MGLRELVLSAFLGFSLATTPVNASPGDRIDVGHRTFHEGNRVNQDYSIGNATITWIQGQSGDWLLGHCYSVERNHSRLEHLRNPDGGVYPRVVSNKILVKTNSGPMWFNGINGSVTPANLQETITRHGRVVRERYGPTQPQQPTQHTVTYVPAPQPTQLTRYVPPTQTRVVQPQQPTSSGPDSLVGVIEKTFRDALVARDDGNYIEALKLIMTTIDFQGNNINRKYLDRLRDWYWEGSQKSLLSERFKDKVRPYFCHVLIQPSDGNGHLIYLEDNGLVTTTLRNGRNDGYFFPSTFNLKFSKDENVNSENVIVSVDYRQNCKIDYFYSIEGGKTFANVTISIDDNVQKRKVEINIPYTPQFKDARVR